MQNMSLMQAAIANQLKANMVFLLLFMSVFYLIGFGLLGYGVWNAWWSLRAASWPVALVTITQLSVEENIKLQEDPTYNVKVQYTYTVDGATYEGSRLAFGYMGSNYKNAHDEIYQKLKEAKGVNVRYDPSDPSVSSLSFGLHRSIWIVILFAVTWLLFCFGFTLLGWQFVQSDGVLLGNLSVQ